ncbi:MAG: nicotinate phosphoribosyltransferase [Verrucomicrobiae bacterium]|nr:nicotinate phosphoribosyltransferase [Verrucomicrobiae bacterium]
MWRAGEEIVVGRLGGLWVDRYELSMAWVYWREGRAREPATFDYFFRTLPFGNGYAVFAGAATLVEWLESYRFDEEACGFLSRQGFPPEFLDYLRGWRFGGTVWTAREGEVVFPWEPVARVTGGLLEAQLIETLLLNVLNFQTLIATKAARCCEAAAGRFVSEFGLRRAQGLGGLWASRAAVIGGCVSTSNMAAAARYDVPSAGTMAHSFVQSYEDELTAFRKFAEVHGSNTVLLLDTYDTLRSGLPHAITVARELAARGQRLMGVRLDSGDLGALAKAVRAGLDAVGLREVKILVSNQLDERAIARLVAEGAPIDGFGVGTLLATGQPDAALDGVYKLAECGGRPRMKISEGLSKANLPGRKLVRRYEDGEGKFVGDVICLETEPVGEEVERLDEELPVPRVAGLEGESVLVPVMVNGEAVAENLVSVRAAAAYGRARREKLPVGVRRLEHAARYPVGMSAGLARLREQLVVESRGTVQ